MIRYLNQDEIEPIRERILSFIELKSNEAAINSYMKYELNIDDAINYYLKFIKNELVRNHYNVFNKAILEYLIKYEYINEEIYSQLKEVLSQIDTELVDPTRDLFEYICNYFNEKHNVNCNFLDLSDIYMMNAESIPEFAIEKKNIDEFVGHERVEDGDEEDNYEDNLSNFFDAVQGDGVILKCDDISSEYKDLLDDLLGGHNRSSAVVSETYHDDNGIFTLQISDDFFFDESQFPFLIILIISLFRGGN